MNIDKELVKCHFSKASCSYDRFANIQKEMANELFESLPKVKNALEIGCGTGYFTKLLNSKCEHLDACDISPQMVDVAKSRVCGVNFFVVDAERLDCGKYDLIASNATFQWFNNLDEALKQYFNMLNSGGVIAFSTFGSDTFWELKEAFGVKSCKERRVTQEFLTKDEIEELLLKTGFIDIEVKSIKRVLFYDSINKMLQAIRGVGASNAIKGGYLGKECYRHFVDYYTKHFVKEDKVYCTYEIIYAKARRES